MVTAKVPYTSQLKALTMQRGDLLAPECKPMVALDGRGRWDGDPLLTKMQAIFMPFLQAIKHAVLRTAPLAR